MKIRPSDVQVLLPYSQLMELLNASEEVLSLRKEIRRLNDQQSALRYQFSELMERLDRILMEI